MPALGQTLADVQASREEPTASSRSTANPVAAPKSTPTAQPTRNTETKSDAGKTTQVVLCAQLLERYESDGYPGRKGNRKWNTKEEQAAHAETLFLRNLRPYFDNIPHADVCQDTLDKYKVLCVSQVKRRIRRPTDG